MPQKQIWRSPEEIVEIGFQRSQVVMLNEAHNGLQRCVRTRRIGKRILPVAHEAGVRHLAMEALSLPIIAERCNESRNAPSDQTAYLGQPEMRSFIQTVLDLGWTLVSYEANPFQWLSDRYRIDFPHDDNLQGMLNQLQPYQKDLMSKEYTNWREEQQALNLIVVLKNLPAGTRLLVWCGNNHHSKRINPDWIPMGYQFRQKSQINPFAIDQIRTVKFEFWDDQVQADLVLPFFEELTKYGGTAGFLVEETPSSLASHLFQDLGNDAYLFSIQNELE